jgi:hypothetical protein
MLAANLSIHPLLLILESPDGGKRSSDHARIPIVMILPKKPDVPLRFRR